MSLSCTCLCSILSPNHCIHFHYSASCPSKGCPFTTHQKRWLQTSPPYLISCVCTEFALHVSLAAHKISIGNKNASEKIRWHRLSFARLQKLDLRASTLRPSGPRPVPSHQARLLPSHQVWSHPLPQCSRPHLVCSSSFFTPASLTTTDSVFSSAHLPLRAHQVPAPLYCVSLSIFASPRVVQKPHLVCFLLVVQLNPTHRNQQCVVNWWSSVSGPIILFFAYSLSISLIVYSRGLELRRPWLLESLFSLIFNGLCLRVVVVVVVFCSSSDSHASYSFRALSSSRLLTVLVPVIGGDLPKISSGSRCIFIPHRHKSHAAALRIGSDDLFHVPHISRFSIFCKLRLRPP